MRRILLLLAALAVFALPAAAAARQPSHAVPGFVVVRDGSADGTGIPVATVVVLGFVLGRVAHEGRVEIYPLTSGSSSLAGQATGADVTPHPVTWHGVPGTRFAGSDFRFRAVGGVWRVVVYGAGVSLYAGGVGRVSVHGSVAIPGDDGVYSLNDGPFASLPSGVLTSKFGTK